jgi:DNA-binding transcriptional LysR family regulator
VKKRSDDLDWDDLKVFAELARSRSLSGAARKLGVTHATVGRRIAQLEAAIGHALVSRRDGADVLTAEGERIATLLGPMEGQVLSITRTQAGRSTDVTGPVRLTATDAIGSLFIVPRLKPLAEQYPGIGLEVIIDQRNLSLARREADIAIRLARPAGGDIVATRLCRICYRFYARREPGAHKLSPGQPYIGYDDWNTPSVENQHFANVTPADRRIAMVTNHLPTRYAAVRAGLGIGLLPQFIGDASGDLDRVPHRGPSLMREAWLLVHKDLKNAARIRVCREFLVDIFAGAKETLCGD